MLRVDGVGDVVVNVGHLARGNLGGEEGDDNQVSAHRK